MQQDYCPAATLWHCVLHDGFMYNTLVFYFDIGGFCYETIYGRGFFADDRYGKGDF